MPLNRQILRADGTLLLVAMIWGMGFVAQKSGLQFIGPFTLNAARFLLGAICLAIMILVRKLYRRHSGRNSANSRARSVARDRSNRGGKSAKSGRRMVLWFCLATGFVMFLAESFQQLGLYFSSVANSGFITSMYVIFVPLIGAIIGKKTNGQTFLAALVSLAGLYFVTVGAKGLPIADFGNAFLLICAVFFAVHVLVIDSAVLRVDPLILSFAQCLTAGILCLIAAYFDIMHRLAPEAPAEIFAQNFDFSSFRDCLIPIGYGGFISIAIAYTLQMVAQKSAPPAHATIMFSNEAIFAGIGGFLLLGEIPSHFAYIGYSLMLAATLLTQFDLLFRNSGKPQQRKSRRA
jgi:drug/metabolite transporter (DMT)-like permease